MIILVCKYFVQCKFILYDYPMITIFLEETLPYRAIVPPEAHLLFIKYSQLVGKTRDLFSPGRGRFTKTLS